MWVGGQITLELLTLAGVGYFYPPTSAQKV